LFRGIPHTARVQQDHIGLRFVQYHAIAAHDEGSRDLLGIALVHLAAVGLDVNAGHGSERKRNARPKKFQSATSSANRTARNPPA
jgi:hypothetical protein